MTTRKTDWYEVLKKSMPHINHVDLLKICEYCIRHADIEARNVVTQDKSTLHLAISTLQKIAESKINFEIAKHPQNTLSSIIYLDHGLFQLPQYSLEDELNHKLVKETTDALIKLMKLKNSQQLSIYHLYSKMLLIDGKSGKEMHITHRYI